MAHPTKPNKRRAEAVRLGRPIRAQAPEIPPAYVVQYVKNTGQIVSRFYRLEHAALRYAERLRAYGKPGVAVFRNSARPRWSKIA